MVVVRVGMGKAKSKQTKKEAAQYIYAWKMSPHSAGAGIYRQGLKTLNVNVAWKRLVNGPGGGWWANSRWKKKPEKSMRFSALIRDGELRYGKKFTPEIFQPIEMWFQSVLHDFAARSHSPRQLPNCQPPHNLPSVGSLRTTDWTAIESIWCLRISNRQKKALVEKHKIELSSVLHSVSPSLWEPSSDWQSVNSSRRNWSN